VQQPQRVTPNPWVNLGYAPHLPSRSRDTCDETAPHHGKPHFVRNSDVERQLQPGWDPRHHGISGHDGAHLKCAAHAAMRPVTVLAQQPAAPVIGFLHSANRESYAPMTTGFTQALAVRRGSERCHRVPTKRRRSRRPNSTGDREKLPIALYAWWCLREVTRVPTAKATRFYHPCGCWQPEHAT